ncbi:uncharacterized protein LOC108212800 [Daucus carota subsp. sativus]|uniref:RING-CH-type domain-containing protein n=1 Tax=Daucus carota subsp. sativus TaxID=79200 RepID=A0A166C7Q5_DAUCS
MGSHNSSLRNYNSTDVIVDIEDFADEFRIPVEAVGRDCRICMMSLDSESAGSVFELGCSCKDDLAAVHEQCAETWFIKKGNNVCEICHSIAQNVAVPWVQHFSDQDDTSSIDEVSIPVFEVDTSATNEFLQPASSRFNAVLQPVLFSTNAILVPTYTILEPAFSTDEVSVPVYEADLSPPNAILVPVSSTNYTDAVPVSSTNAAGVAVSNSRTQYCIDCVDSFCEKLVCFLITLVIVMEILQRLYN